MSGTLGFHTGRVRGPVVDAPARTDAAVTWPSEGRR